MSDQLTVDPPAVWESCPPCDPPAFLPANIEESVVVNLCNPQYVDGVISTEEGGVLIAENQRLRIQGQRILYTRLPDATPPLFTVQCQGDLLVDYKEHVLVGDSFYFDLVSSTGFVMNGKMAAFPWFLGGEMIRLMKNGDIVITNGYITTSEGGENDVMLTAAEILVTRDQIVTVRDVKFKLKQIPLLWFPEAQVDLNTTVSSPLAFNFGWDGLLGSHAGVRYHFLTLGEFKGFLRADAYVSRGLGIGLETEYDPLFSPTESFTRSYYAHDISIDDPEKRDRYRFQGTYYSSFADKTSLNLMYDFVSDAEMAADYETYDFDLNTAQRTEITLRRQEEWWISNLFTRVRVNSFQSINQELPTFEMSLHPFEIYETGIIAENLMKVGFLHYIFSDDVKAKGFHSGRFEVRPRVYRPFNAGPLTITPQASFVGISYSNNMFGHTVGQALGDLSVNAETLLSRFYPFLKHVFEPYAEYHLLTTPRAPLDNHFLFTIDDAYAHLSILRFGVRQGIIRPGSPCFLSPLWIDLWANAFFDTKTEPQPIPKGYLDIEFQLLPNLFMGIDAAWNFQDHLLDYYNARGDWTISDRIALGVEYRHRSRFDWRKADFYNFLLESVRTQKELLASPLSERRDTALGRIFCRITPDLGARFEVRRGWDRIDQPGYFEYLMEFQSVIFQHWHFLFTYEKRTEDHRFSVTFKLDRGPP